MLAPPLPEVELRCMNATPRSREGVCGHVRRIGGVEIESLLGESDEQESMYKYICVKLYV